jgi:GntR family transcriptional regulator
MIVQRLGVPIYLQVKNYILDKLKSGDFQPGDKLPTERDLAKTLDISRNTVSAAYKELLLEGILEARQGRGTFVREQTDEYLEEQLPGSRLERMIRVMDNALEKAVELGFTVDQFIAIANVRAHEKEAAIGTIRVAVVDATQEYLTRFLQQISQTTTAVLEGVLISDLADGTTRRELLGSCDYVVTTVAHQAEVHRIMGTTDKLITLAVTPKFEATLKLARIPAKSSVGIVANSSGFAKSVQELLRTVTVGGIDVSVALNFTDQALKEFCPKQDVLIIAEEEQMRMAAFTTAGQQIIPFYYEIDQGSLHQLKARLVSQPR